MKYLITLTAGYLLPSIAPYINLDVVLGIAAGVLLGLLLAMLFIGPTPEPKAQPAKVAKMRKPRRIIEQPAKMQYGLSIFNYTPTEWGIA